MFEPVQVEAEEHVVKKKNVPKKGRPPRLEED
jgi:hypothetical protein